MNEIKVLFKVLLWVAVGAAVVLTGGIGLVILILGGIGKVAMSVSNKKAK